MKTLSNHGFTLIEVLVVVSIFGLISSVALANLESARNKAQIANGQQFHASVERSFVNEANGAWEFNEGAGAVSVDSSENGLQGDIVGATYVTDSMTGSYALSFDGTDYVQGTGFPNPGDDADMTVVTWIRPTNIAASSVLFNAGGSTCTALQIGIMGGKIYAASSPSTLIAPGPIGDDEGEVTTDRVVVNNSWQNIAFTMKGNKTQTYVNGVQKELLDGAGTSSCDGGDWSIGAANGSFGYQGIIDSFHIYNTALSASDIRKVYAQGQNETFRASAISATKKETGLNNPQPF